MSRFLFAFVAFALPAGSAWATCGIHNDTGYSFKVESGNVSNQSVGSHTLTTIAAGNIVAKTDDGKSVTGACKDGDKIKIVEESGKLVIKPE
ncbi:MAG: hypothetical protein ABMB14_31315 [Myxococcota bacterium]